ncbi:unnamed protein product [Prorocentrum cordatum]|uniref:Uncharacterized protein n=1 Tax=Prorocentrum cordatum TaxID=2364126 RepID=A0ABN9RIR9_9DINO|nr:unnamed protein product [Polarella glacialis]
MDSSIALFQRFYAWELLENCGTEKASGAGSISLDTESSDIAHAAPRVAALAPSRPGHALVSGKTVSWHLAGTRRVGLQCHATQEFAMGGPLPLDARADASFEDVGAQVGVSLYIFGCLVVWRSVRLLVAPVSAAEADVNSLAVGENVSAAAAVNANRSRMTPGLLELLFVAAAKQRADVPAKCGGAQRAARIRQHFGLRALSREGRFDL